MSFPRQDQGRLIQLDGIDGAGKSTLVGAARTWAEQRNMRVFDVVEFSRREQRPPTLAEIGDADLLMTAEPTHAWIGSAIRQEIIQADAPYDAEIAAHAFALDRAVHYRRLLLPFLSARPNRWVIFERGLLSSLAYQPLQNELDPSPSKPSVTVSSLLSLPGNRIALENPPDVFIFLNLDTNEALKRIEQRGQPTDRFEDPTFQLQLAARFQSAEVAEPLTSRGTRFVVLDGGQTKEQVAIQMTKLLNELIDKRPVS